MPAPPAAAGATAALEGAAPARPPPEPVGAAPAGAAHGFGVAFGGIGFGPPLPNCITTGTGPFALAGVTSVKPIFTAIAGYEALSTRPTSCFVTTGTSLKGAAATPPPNPRAATGKPVSILTTSHFTAG